jgi:hypothetical protein
MRSGPKPPQAGTALRKAAMAIWCVCFCGMQWRAIGLLCDMPFGTLYGLFARWTRLGLWRRLLDRLRCTWRRACGDGPEPSAVVIDSRSCRSAPSCFDRGIDGGKKIPGVKIHLAVDKYGVLSCDRRLAGEPAMTRRILFRGRSLMAVSRARHWAISAIGASRWPKAARSSALPSRRLLAGTMDSSFRPASAGWWSALSHG